MSKGSNTNLIDGNNRKDGIPDPTKAEDWADFDAALQISKAKNMPRSTEDSDAALEGHGTLKLPTDSTYEIRSLSRFEQIDMDNSKDSLPDTSKTEDHANFDAALQISTASNEEISTEHSDMALKGHGTLKLPTDSTYEIRSLSRFQHIETDNSKDSFPDTSKTEDWADFDAALQISTATDEEKSTEQSDTTLKGRGTLKPPTDSTYEIRSLSRFEQIDMDNSKDSLPDASKTEDWADFDAALQISTATDEEKSTEQSDTALKGHGTLKPPTDSTYEIRSLSRFEHIETVNSKDSFQDTSKIEDWADFDAALQVSAATDVERSAEHTQDTTLKGLKKPTDSTYEIRSLSPFEPIPTSPEVQSLISSLGIEDAERLSSLAQVCSPVRTRTCTPTEATGDPEYFSQDEINPEVHSLCKSEDLQQFFSDTDIPVNTECVHELYKDNGNSKDKVPTEKAMARLDKEEAKWPTTVVHTKTTSDGTMSANQREADNELANHCGENDKDAKINERTSQKGKVPYAAAKKVPISKTPAKLIVVRPADDVIDDTVKSPRARSTGSSTQGHKTASAQCTTSTKDMNTPEKAARRGGKKSFRKILRDIVQCLCGCCSPQTE